MKSILSLVFCVVLCGAVLAQPCDAQAQVAQQRKVIKPPVNLAGQKRVPQSPQIPGKQDWQKPQMQQPQVQPNHRQNRIIIGNQYYIHPYYYRVYRSPMIYNYYGPPVIVQPQPVPVYPTPFSGFFFHFRF